MFGGKKATKLSQFSQIDLLDKDRKTNQETTGRKRYHECTVVVEEEEEGVEEAEEEEGFVCLIN